MNYKLVFEGHLLDLLAVYCWWISLKSAQMMVLAGYPDTRLDFRRSLGPPREKTAGRVSTYRVWRKFKTYDLCVVTKHRKWERSKYQTHVVLCLLVALVFAIKISRNTYWFKVLTLILHKQSLECNYKRNGLDNSIFHVSCQQPSLHADWKIIYDQDSVGWISKTYLPFSNFSKLTLFFVNISCF